MTGVPKEKAAAELIEGGSSGILNRKNTPDKGSQRRGKRPGVGKGKSPAKNVEGMTEKDNEKSKRLSVKAEMPSEKENGSSTPASPPLTRKTKTSHVSSSSRYR